MTCDGCVCLQTRIFVLQWLSKNKKKIMKFKALVIVLFVVATAGYAGAVSAANSTISSTITDVPAASARQLSSGSSNKHTYRSPKFRPTFSFNGVGLRWQGAKDLDSTFFLRTAHGKWWPVSMTEDSKDQAESFVSEPLFISGEFIQYKVVGKGLEKLQSVQLIYFDSRNNVVSDRKMQADTTAQDSHIISRAEWGADETLQTWRPQHATPKKIVIHHTAGSNGGDDPLATINGIYYWQSTILGWGDIGYNYLVDPAGNIYEGRSGGSGTIGAHAYNSIRDINYNVGSIGIAVLGCYEHSSGACAKVSDYTPATQVALTNLIARHAKEFNFRPVGNSMFIDRVTKNVITHRDIDYTLCPGNGIRDQLLDLRWSADMAYWSLLGKQAYQANVVDSTLSTSYNLAKASPAITMQYQNVGLYDWPSEGMILKVRILGTQYMQKIPLSEAVLVNQTVTIPFTWQLPVEPGTYQVVTKLLQHGQYVPGSHVHHSVTIIE